MDESAWSCAGSHPGSCAFLPDQSSRKQRLIPFELLSLMSRRPGVAGHPLCPELKCWISVSSVSGVGAPQPPSDTLTILTSSDCRCGEFISFGVALLVCTRKIRPGEGDGCLSVGNRFLRHRPRNAFFPTDLISLENCHGWLPDASPT